MEQAERDIAAAEAQLQAGFPEWSCFISQQAAEKAAKAALQRFGAEAWGHSVLQLLKAIGEQVRIPPEAMQSASVLDRFYIISRYPNGFASGKPGDYLSDQDAHDAISSSKIIIRFCNGILA